MMGKRTEFAAGLVVAAVLAACDGKSNEEGHSGDPSAGSAGEGGSTNVGGSSSGGSNVNGGTGGDAGSNAGGAAGSGGDAGSNAGGAAGSSGDAGSNAGGAAGTGGMSPNEDCFRLCGATDFDCTLSSPAAQGAATISTVESYGCSGVLILAGEAPDLWLRCDRGEICVEHENECLPSTFTETSFGYLIPDKGTTVSCVLR